MTPALRSAFLAAPSGAAHLLPRTWRGRALFTEAHVVALLETLRFGGVSLDRAARDACGLRNAIDAGKALAAACEACPALAAEVTRAESEGRARLRVEGVGNGVVDVGGSAEIERGTGAVADAGARGSNGREAEHEGGEQVHAPQVAAAAMVAQGRDAWAALAARSAAMEAEASRVEIVAALSPLDAIAHEAAAYAPGDFGYVLRLDARCIVAGMPGMSPWWRFSVGGFFASGKPWGIFDVGRGAGKSTILELVAASVARYGVRKIPPGQTWTVPFVSVGPDDANRRINGIAARFRADGLSIIGEDDGSGKAREGVKITRAPRGALDLEDIRGNPIQLASVAGTIGNMSGPSTVFLLIDEAAKLHDKSTNANPLTEIIASAAQTSRARPGWRAIVCSSAWERSGAHFQLVEQGDNESNYVARIGQPFLEDTLRGFEMVAAWEQMAGDLAAARMIREHAASLTALSPLVPTWTANPTLGNPGGPYPWDGAALASRKLVQVLPEAALDGIPRTLFWLRECASVPLDRGAGGANAAAQCLMAAGMTSRLATGGPRRPMPQVMPIPGAQPGDPRYGGPQAQPGAKRGGWRTRGVF